jgi:hypothetical protein
MAVAGFVYQEVYGVHLFLDGPDGRPRSAIHLLFANEKVQQDYAEPAPELSRAAGHDAYKLIELESLVRMKLTSFRDKDRTHLRDLIEVGLIDESWVHRFSSELGCRLQALIDNPGG